MNKRLIILRVSVLLIALALGSMLYVKTRNTNFKVDQLGITREDNPPSFNGVKSDKAINIAMKVTYKGVQKKLQFTSTCQNADLSLMSHNGRLVPKINSHMCGTTLTSRSLSSGDTIEAQELFDMSGLEYGSYTLVFSYQDVLHFEKEVTIE